MKNIIAISGKFGSGKSHIARYISERTGAEVHFMDAHLIKTLMRPVVRTIAERKTKAPLSTEFDHLLCNFRYVERTNPLLRFLLRWQVNKKIKRLGRLDVPVIIDFFWLPASKYAKRFGSSILVQSDEDTRIQKIMARNDFDRDTAMRVDGLATQMIDYDDYKFDYVIQNDYKVMPKEVNDIIDVIQAQMI